MIKKKAAFLILFFLASCFILPADEPAQSILRLRAFKEKKPLTSLKKDDIKLLFADSNREIEDLIKKEKSIGLVPGLGRHFILSFSMMAYNKQFEEGISYFITEILRPEDTLLLYSPLKKTYPVKIHADKEKMLREIAGILAKDCYLYSEARIAAEKKLLTKLRNARRLITYPYQRQGFFLGIVNFLESFPTSFLEFKGQYLLPDADKYRHVLDILRAGKGEGQRWWIHLRKHDLNALLFRIKNLLHDINSFFSYGNIFIGQRTVIQQKIRNFKKKLAEHGTFSGPRLLKTLLEGEAGYHIIFTGGAKNIDANVVNTVTAGLEEMLEKVSIQSGGVTKRTSRFDNGLASIKDHVDHYYNLVFFSGSEPQTGNIRVELKEKQDDVTLVYNDNFTKEEPASSSQDHSQGKVKITGFSQEENIIRFSIESFKVNEDSEKRETFGLLKVEVNLSDPQGEKVYHRCNTLRASKDRSDITLSLPLDRHGQFKLSITVLDIIANNKTSLKNDITL
jgi:hypothetical protein